MIAISRSDCGLRRLRRFLTSGCRRSGGGGDDGRPAGGGGCRNCSVGAESAGDCARRNCSVGPASAGRYRARSCSVGGSGCPRRGNRCVAGSGGGVSLPRQPGGLGRWGGVTSAILPHQRESATSLLRVRFEHGDGIAARRGHDRQIAGSAQLPGFVIVVRPDLDRPIRRSRDVLYSASVKAALDHVVITPSRGLPTR
jgi:hypothetical protein